MAKKKPNTKPKETAEKAKHRNAAPLTSAGLPNQYWLLFACLLITLICYMPSITNGWTTWDDEGYVYGNDLTKHLSFSTLSQFFTTYQMGNYHPLAMLSLAFDYLLFNMNAAGFHIHSLLLHLVNVMLVFIFIKQLTRKIWVATITALFFGIHPAHIESVAWISERKDLLYVMYYFAALIAYINYVRTDKKMFFYLVTLCLFVLSLFSKGQAVTFPVALILVDYYLRRHITVKVWLEKIPFFLLSFVFGIVALFAQHSDKAFRFSMKYTFTDRLFFSADSFLTYFFKALLPLKLSAYYPYPLMANGRYEIFTLVSPVLFLLLLAAVIYSMKRGRVVAFGFAFFFINVILILQLLPVGGAIMADRYTYLSYVGLFFLMGTGVQWLLDNTRSKFSGLKVPAIGIALLCAVFFSIATFARTRIWKGDESLFMDMVNNYSYIPEANYGLGAEYVKEGKTDLALKYLSNAIRLTPDYPEPSVRRFYLYTKTDNIDSAIIDYNHLQELESRANNYRYSPSMTFNLAVECAKLGKLNLAVNYFTKAISYQQNEKELLVGRSDVYRQEGKTDSAIIDCNKVLLMDGNNADAYVSRGIAYAITGKYDLAMGDFNNAVRIDPRNVKAFGNRGNLFDMREKYDSAIADYTMALQYDSTYFEIYGNRGRTFMKKGMVDAAIKDFTLAIQHSPADPENYVLRCDAYVKKGDYSQALNDGLIAQSKGKQVNPAYLDMLRGKIATNQ